MPRYRKPRVMKSQANRIFPRIEVEDDRIWIQSSPAGKWTKVPPKRALFLADRLKRCAKYVGA